MTSRLPVGCDEMFEALLDATPIADAEEIEDLAEFVLDECVNQPLPFPRS